MRKKINRGNFWTGLGIFGFVLMIVAFLGFMVYELNKEQKYTDSFIGKEVVLHHDTLMIFDYNSWQDAYIMSNGVVVDEDLVQSLEIIEE